MFGEWEEIYNSTNKDKIYFENNSIQRIGDYIFYHQMIDLNNQLNHPMENIYQ